MKRYLYLITLISIFLFTGCASFSVLVGEKLGHVLNDPVGTIYTRKVECIVRSNNGVETINRTMTSEIIGYNEMAGSVTPKWKDHYKGGREMLFINKNNKKLILKIPSGYRLRNNSVTIDRIDGGYLISPSGKKEFLGYTKLTNSEAVSKYGFKLISLKTTTIDKKHVK